MADTYHDREVTYQRYHKKWMAEQNRMRPQLNVQDTFDWQLPSHVQIQFDATSKFGQCTVSKDAAAHRSTSQKRPLRYVGGVDISFAKPGAFEKDTACAGLMIYEYPSMQLVHRETEIVTLQHPYIAGFLAFREVSHLVKLIRRVQRTRPSLTPDVILVDGNGILHYRRMGLATHLSMEVDIPCVGVAKKLLVVDGIKPNIVEQRNKRLRKSGSFHKLHGRGGDQIGVALRTRLRGDVLFVSPGNRISCDSAVKLAMLCWDGKSRLPLPVEMADKVTRQLIRRYTRQHQTGSVDDSRDVRGRRRNRTRCDDQSSAAAAAKWRRAKPKKRADVESKAKNSHRASKRRRSRDRVARAAVKWQKK